MLAEKDCEQRIIGSCHPGNRIYCISKESSISLHNWKDFLLIMWARFFFLPSIKSMWNNVSCCAKAEQCGVVQRNAQTQHDRFCCDFGCWSKHWQIQDLPEPSVPWLYQQCIRCWQVFVNTHLSFPSMHTKNPPIAFGTDSSWRMWMNTVAIITAILKHSNLFNFSGFL